MFDIKMKAFAIWFYLNKLIVDKKLKNEHESAIKYASDILDYLCGDK